MISKSTAVRGMLSALYHVAHLSSMLHTDGQQTLLLHSCRQSRCRRHTTINSTYGSRVTCQAWCTEVTLAVCSGVCLFVSHSTQTASHQQREHTVPYTCEMMMLMLMMLMLMVFSHLLISTYCCVPDRRFYYRVPGRYDTRCTVYDVR